MQLILLERVTWAEKWRAIIVVRMRLRLQFTWNLEPASAASCTGMAVALSAALALYSGVLVTKLSSCCQERYHVGRRVRDDNGSRAQGRGWRCAMIVIPASATVADGTRVRGIIAAPVSVDDGEITSGTSANDTARMTVPAPRWGAVAQRRRQQGDSGERDRKDDDAHIVGRRRNESGTRAGWWRYPRQRDRQDDGARVRG
jgi:hypothetical protein